MPSGEHQSGNFLSIQLSRYHEPTQGKRAPITGASSGIRLETARQFLKGKRGSPSPAKILPNWKRPLSAVPMEELKQLEEPRPSCVVQSERICVWRFLVRPVLGIIDQNRFT